MIKFRELHLLLGVFAFLGCGGDIIVPHAPLPSTTLLQNAPTAPAKTLPIEVHFSPFDPVEERVLELLEEARSEVLIAHYNIRRTTVLGKLVELAARGVRVRVVVDEKTSRQPWNTGDDFLVAQGIELVRMKPAHPYGLMHLKATVIDSFTVMTGSFNWNTSASLANDETFMVLRGESAARAYGDKIRELLGESVPVAPAEVLAPGVTVHFVPDENVEELIITELNQAQSTVDLAMFALTEWDIGHALVRATERGVRVRLVTSPKMANYSWVDEALEEHDATVLRGANRLGRHTAMHSKYCIIDGERLLTGAANWSLNGTGRSVEDLLVIEDAAVITAHQANFADLLSIYGDLPSYTGSRAEAPVLFHARVHHTEPGDTALVVGEDPALGSWDPGRAPHLRTAAGFFPNWTVPVDLPANKTIEYKWVILRANGDVEWEPGPNRVLHTSPQGRAMVTSGEFGATLLSWAPVP